jgi:hypothetical protein
VTKSANSKDDASINNAMLSLSRCVLIACKDFGSDKYVPYRDNILTQVVSKCLEGENQCLFLSQVRNDFEDSFQSYQSLGWLRHLHGGFHDALVADDDLETLIELLEQQLIEEADKKRMLDQQLYDIRSDEKYESFMNVCTQLLGILSTYSEKSQEYFGQVSEAYLRYKQHRSYGIAWKALHVNIINDENLKTVCFERIDTAQKEFARFKKKLILKVDVLIKEASNSMSSYDQLMLERATSQLLHLLEFEGQDLRSLAFHLKNMVCFQYDMHAEL